MKLELNLLDVAIRHYIYQRFIHSTLPPTTENTAKHFHLSIVNVEESYERLTGSHQIALAPGSHSIWMRIHFPVSPQIM